MAKIQGQTESGGIPGLKKLELLIERSKAAISCESATGGDDSEDEDTGGDDDFAKFDFIEELTFRVQMVLDLVPALESTLEHVKRSQKQLPYPITESLYASDPAQIYISVIRDKFPQADERLIQRLGEANWQRHINIRKRMQQRVGFDETVDTTVGSIFQPPTLFHDSGIDTTIGTQSRNTYSNASHTSFKSDLADKKNGIARIPSTPSEVGVGAPFCCNLCGQMQHSIRSRLDWK